jgi:predicted O-methyltransferase YrrM
MKEPLTILDLFPTWPREWIGCTLEEYQFLSEVSGRVKPRSILEIGCGYGASITSLLLGAITEEYKVKITCVDMKPRSEAHRLVASELLEKAIWEFFEMKSSDFFPLSLPQESYDLIFVDADHTESGSLEDLKFAIKVRSPNGVIIVHDLQHPGTEYIKSHCRKLALEHELPFNFADHVPGHGMGVIG